MTRNTRSRAVVNSTAQIDVSKKATEQDTVFALTAPGSKLNEINDGGAINDAGNNLKASHQQSGVNLKHQYEAAAEPQSELPRVSTNPRVRERMKLLEEQKRLEELKLLAANSTPVGNISAALPSNLSTITPIPIVLEHSHKTREDVCVAKNSEVVVVTSSVKFVDSEAEVGAGAVAGQSSDVGLGNGVVAGQSAAVGHGNDVSPVTLPLGIESETTEKEYEGNLKQNGENSEKEISTYVSKSPCLDVVKNNRSIEHMGKLNERLDGVSNESITLTWDDVYKEEEEEARCLIGLFNGIFPGRDLVQSMVDTWPRACKFHFHRSGWIIFVFDSNEDVLDVMHSGRFYAGNRRMIAKQMPRFFNFSREDHSLVPVWIQLPNLPTSCWKQESIEKICTYMGKPLYVDLLKKEQESLSFARCCVEMDVSVKLHDLLTVIFPDGSILKQVVLYEEKTDWCKKCKKVGHTENICYAPSVPGVSLYVPKSRFLANNMSNSKNFEKGISSNLTQRNRGRSRNRGGNSWNQNQRPANVQNQWPANVQNQRPCNVQQRAVNRADLQLAKVAEKGVDEDPGVRHVPVQNLKQRGEQFKEVEAVNGDPGVLCEAGAVFGNHGTTGTSDNPISVSNKFAAFSSWANESEMEEDSHEQASEENQRQVANVQNHRNEKSAGNRTGVQNRQNSAVCKQSEAKHFAQQTAVQQHQTAVQHHQTAVNQHQTAVQQHQPVVQQQKGELKADPQRTYAAANTKPVELNVKPNGAAANVRANVKGNGKGNSSLLKPK